MRGMNGDRRKDGTTRSATVPGIDLDNTSAVTTDNLDIADVTDHDQFSGQLRQEIVYDGATAISTTVNNLWAERTASQQKSYADVKAYFVRTARSYSHTYLTAARTWRQAATSFTYDTTYGMVTTVENHGDWTATGDETCTRTWYARNDANGLTATVSRTRIVGRRAPSPTPPWTCRPTTPAPATSSPTRRPRTIPPPGPRPRSRPRATPGGPAAPRGTAATTRRCGSRTPSPSTTRSAAPPC